MPGFLSNLFKLATGTVIAQAVAIGLVPVVTRIYSPEFLGVAQLFLSIGTLLVVISTLSYHLALMLPEKDEDSINIFMLSIVCVLGTSIVSGAIFTGFADWFGNVFNMPLISGYLIWLPFFVIVASLFLILTEWFSRKVRYGSLAKSAVLNSVSSRIFQVGGGLLLLSPLGFILGSVMGYALADLFLLHGFKRDIGLLKSVKVERIRDLAVQYRHFTFYGSLGSIANSFTWNLPTFMLAYFFSPAVVGYYALAIMAVKMPMTIVGEAIAQVFFQKASEEKIKTGGVKVVVREIHTRLISLGIFPFIVFIILSQDLFTFIFGANWLTAGIYAMILAPWIFTVFIVAPIATLFAVLERQKALFFFEISTLCTLTLVSIIGGTSGDPALTLAIISASGVLIWGSKSIYLTRQSRVGSRDSLLSLLKHLLLSIIVSAPLMLGVYLDLPFFLLLGIAGITAIIYYSLLFFTDTLLRQALLELLRDYVPIRYIDWANRI